jgi:hypothetical protein
MNEVTRPYVFENLLRRLKRGSLVGDFLLLETQI